MSRNLGTLTLDLVAKTAGFVEGMSKAERSTKKFRENAVKNAKLAGAAIGTLGVGLLAKFISETKNTEKVQAQLAAVLKSTGEAAGFSQKQLNAMALSMESMSVFSTGEINEAQTTLLAFTGIVGDQYPRAMQAAADMAARTGNTIKNAAETIGRALDVPSKGLSALSRQGFRFTEDQKRLVEALEASGKTAEAQGIILNALEESYGGAAEAARNTFSGALTAVQNSLSALMTGGDGSLNGATEKLNEFNDKLRDPETKAAVDKLVSAFITLGGWGFSALEGLVEIGDMMAFSAANAGGFVDELGQLESELKNVDRAIKGGIDTPIKFLFTSDEELRRLRDEIQAKIDALDPPKVTVDVADYSDIEALKAKRTEKLALAQAAAAKEAERLAKEYAKQQEAIQKQIDSLDLAAKTVGMTKDEVVLYRLALDGANDAQLASARAALESVAAHEKLQDQQRDYESLVKSLRTEEEKRIDTLKEQMAVLDAINGISEEQRKILKDRIASGSMSDELSVSIGGDKDSLDKASRELEKWYADQMNRLEQFRRERADLNEQWDEEELRVKQERDAKYAEIERANNELLRQQKIEGYNTILTAMGEYYRGMEGKEAAYARVAISLSQALLDEKKRAALQSIWADTHKAAMGAYAAMADIPYVGPALGAAAAGVVYVAGGAAAAKLTGMAHDGIDRVPEEGTWLLNKGERVLTENTSAKLDRTLDKLDNGGSVNTVVNINIDNNGETTRGGDSESREMANAIKAVVVDEIARQQRPGGILWKRQYGSV